MGIGMSLRPPSVSYSCLSTTPFCASFSPSPQFCRDGLLVLSFLLQPTGLEVTHFQCEEVSNFSWIFLMVFDTDKQGRCLVLRPQTNLGPSHYTGLRVSGQRQEHVSPTIDSGGSTRQEEPVVLSYNPERVCPGLFRENKSKIVLIRLNKFKTL